MNQYAVSNFTTCLMTILLAVFVFFFNKKSRLNKFFCLYSLSISVWSFFTALHASAASQSISLISAKILHLAVPFIPILFFHFCVEILESYNRQKYKLFIGYLISAVFILINLTSRLIVLRVTPKLGYYYFTDGGSLYPFLIIYFAVYALMGLYLLLKGCSVAQGNKRNQMRYLFWGSLLGYMFGSSCFLPVYNITIFPYPVGSYVISLYVFITAYAILKHRLMDINIALTRAGIFVFVYALVLGIPFGLAGWAREWLVSIWGQNWFWIPMIILLVLATAGPFIYQSLRKQAEELILKEQKQYQKALLETSSRMLLIKELNRLLETAGATIMETVKVSFAGIYIEDEKTRKYAARYKQARERECGLPEEFAAESELARHLSANKLPIIGEEVTGSSYKIGLAVPFMVNDVLLGFMLLGEKYQNRAYTQDDVNVFTIMANQIAMSIENCQFYGREKENQAMIYQSATLADMGVMADSMGHQIKNHIQKMTAQAGSQAGIIEEFLNQGIDKEKAEQLLRRLVNVLCKIESQGEAGGRLIESISRFSRLPLESYREISLKEIVESANDILRFKVNFEEIDYQVNLPDTLPILYAHPVFAEAFVNLIDNANDAIKERADKLEFRAKNNGEPPAPYRGSIAISAAERDSQIEIEVEDNGIGIKKENARNLFLPFYTTKATTNKGTGLGLYVIKRIVSDHGGRISIDSDYMRGTKFTITMPIRQKGKEA